MLFWLFAGAGEIHYKGASQHTHLNDRRAQEEFESRGQSRPAFQRRNQALFF
jgi:hypothetical protein